jgi:poly-gamma-glutamate capsule biosynthesis protein CapA/YwtB (metallophosphatase superfamily)
MRMQLSFLILVLTIAAGGAPAPSLEPVAQLAIVGDILLGGGLAGTLASKGPDWPWRKAAPLLWEADLTLGNLETAVTAGGAPASKQYTFRSDPRTLSGPANAGMDILSLANNHSLDYGQAALLETIQHVRDAAMLPVGAGRDATEALAPVILNVKGLKIAVLGFSRVLPFGHWAAGEKHAGLAPGWDPKVVVNAIRQAKASADVVVVLVHWGEEVKAEPRQADIDLAGQMIAAGATVVAGHHPHVLQGIDRRGTSLVAYSLGNFIFTTVPRRLNQETGILQVTVDRQGVREARFTPLYIAGGQPGPVPVPLRRQILGRLDRLSQRWQTRVAPDGTITPAAP